LCSATCYQQSAGTNCSIVRFRLGAGAEYRDFDLPPRYKALGTRRKAVIVNAVRSGEISLEEVCRRYELSAEEFLAWQRAIDAHGVPSLPVTRPQIYRDNPLPLG